MKSENIHPIEANIHKHIGAKIQLIINNFAFCVPSIDISHSDSENLWLTTGLTNKDFLRMWLIALLIKFFIF